MYPDPIVHTAYNNSSWLIFCIVLSKMHELCNSKLFRRCLHFIQGSQMVSKQWVDRSSSQISRDQNREFPHFSFSFQKPIQAWKFSQNSIFFKAFPVVFEIIVNTLRNQNLKLWGWWLLCWEIFLYCML